MWYAVWIVPAFFCAMRYVNKGWYLTQDEVPEGLRLGKGRRNSVELYQNESPSIATSFKMYKQLDVRVLRSLKMVRSYL